MSRSTKHVAAIADQGFYSASNFALNILLARWLVDDQYGAFGTTYAIFLMLSLIHTALLTEPMLIFGSQHHRERIFNYYRSLLRFHGVLTGLFTLLAVVVWFSLRRTGHASMSDGALGIALSSWAVLLFYLYRKLCYVIDRIGAAAIAGAVYFVALTVLTLGLFRSGRLGVFEAYAAMGASALVATLVLHVLVWPRNGDLETPTLEKREILREHYGYGRWAFGTGLLIWFPANIYYLVLPYTGGLPANAAFKALMNFAMPMIQANMALAAVLLPGLARIPEPGRFRQHQKRFTAVVATACLAYWILIGSMAGTLFRLLYDGRYMEYSRLMWLVGLMPLVSWLALAERSAHKAINRPDVVFRATAVGAGVSGSLGLVLTYRYSVNGAVLAIILAYATMYLWLQRSSHLLNSERLLDAE